MPTHTPVQELKINRQLSSQKNCLKVKKNCKMVKAQRHPASAASSSSAAASDPLRGVTKEQVEIQMYLSKLKELVPHMPKNRKVSKLEVIQHVIDYICDLQSELEQNHPASLNRNRRKQARRADALPPSSSTILLQRQPLGLLTSTTSVDVNNTTAESDVIVPC